MGESKNYSQLFHRTNRNEPSGKNQMISLERRDGAGEGTAAGVCEELIAVLRHVYPRAVAAPRHPHRAGRKTGKALTAEDRTYGLEKRSALHKARGPDGPRQEA